MRTCRADAHGMLLSRRESSRDARLPPRRGASWNPVRRQMTGAEGGVVSEALKEKSTTSTRRFKPYPAYKDSRVEWLGELPTSWEVKRLKFVAPTRISKLNAKPDDAVYVGLEHVESWTGRLLLDNQPESVESVVASFKAGDVLLGKLRPYLAKAARPDFDGVCTSEILPLRPTAECSQSYVMYC